MCSCVELFCFQKRAIFSSVWLHRWPLPSRWHITVTPLPVNTSTVSKESTHHKEIQATKYTPPKYVEEEEISVLMLHIFSNVHLNIKQSITLRCDFHCFKHNNFWIATPGSRCFLEVKMNWIGFNDNWLHWCCVSLIAETCDLWPKLLSNVSNQCHPTSSPAVWINIYQLRKSSSEDTFCCCCPVSNILSSGWTYKRLSSVVKILLKTWRLAWWGICCCRVLWAAASFSS